MRMLVWYVSQGVSTVVATPHVDSGSNDNWRGEYDRALKEVQGLAAPLGIRIVGGAEVRLAPDLESEMVRPIDGTDYVLVDFPTGTWPFYADDMLFHLQVLGYRAILAHPERYGWESGALNIARSLVSRGVVLQVTLASFTGYFGGSARQTAIDLLEGGVVHILATDAHESGGRLAAVEQSLSSIKKLYGGEMVDQLVHRNPSEILRGNDVVPVKASKNVLRRMMAFRSRNH